jgi:hypothetical protein
MTASVATPILSRNPPSPEQLGSERHKAPTSGDFANLIHQAVLKPQPRTQGTTSRTNRAAGPAAKEVEQHTEEAAKTSTPKKAKDSVGPRMALWSVGSAAPASSQPLIVPVPAPERSGSKQAPSDSADAGFPLRVPTGSTGENGHGSPCIDQTQSLIAPAQRGKPDLSSAFTPSFSTPIALPKPAPAGWQKGTEDNEDASPRMDQTQSPAGPAQKGKPDLSSAFTPAFSTPIALPKPAPAGWQRGTEDDEDASPRMDSSEAREMPQDGEGNACKHEPAKTESHREVPAALRTEPGPPGTENTLVSDLPEQLGAASAPQPVSSDQPLPPSQVTTLEPAPGPAPRADGMSAALHRNTMQTAREVDENACRTEQILPVLKAAADSPRPVEQARKSSATAADCIAVSPAAAAEAVVMMSNRPAGHASLAQTETSSTLPTPGQAVERAVENAVVGLQHANATSLAVVLKPDGNTEISLHLKLQHGHFEAFAVLERGDFKSLDSEWGQLQGRLADHGIRLAPLASNLPRTATFAGGQFSSPKQQRDNTASADFPGSPIKLSPARKSGAPIVRSTTGREWWA